MSAKNWSEFVKLQHFQKKSQLGACKITEFMGKSNTRHILQENMLLFWKHNWQEFYMTAGRGGCDKFQLCVTSAGLPTARHSGRLLNFASKISHYCPGGRDSGVDSGSIVGDNILLLHGVNLYQSKILFVRFWHAVSTP